MHYLKLFEAYTQKQLGDIIEIEDLLEEYNISNYTINKDGTVDVDGDVYIDENNLMRIPVRFNRIYGCFFCNNNNLISLKGSPIYVEEDFYCYENELTNLIGAPKEVGGSVIIFNNPLPKEIVDISSDFNKIKEILKNQDEYGIWNTDGSLNEYRFNIMMEEIN